MATHETAPSTSQTRDTDTHENRTTRWLLACGSIGPILFIIVYTIEGATRPGYDAWRQAVSALSLSGWGWMQIVNFVICGTLVLGFAIGLRRALSAKGHGATWGPRLVAVVGIGLLVAGVLVTDPAQGYPPGTPDGPAVASTLHGNLHFFVGAPSVFGVLPIACYVMARYFSGRVGWRGWALYSVVTGIAMWASFAGFIIAGLHNGPAGLFERIAISAGFIWLALLALRLLKARSRIERTTVPAVQK